MPHLRLRTRIMAWSFIPTAIILFAVALVTFYAYEQVTQDLVAGRNREVARLAAGQVAIDLAGYADVLDHLAHTAEIYSDIPQRQATALQNAANQLAIFDAGVIALDSYGHVTSTWPARPELAGADWSNRTFFRQMLRTARPIFSDLVADGPQNSDVIAVTVPIVTDQGNSAGALIGQFRIGATGYSAFYGGIVRQRLGEVGATYLVDSNGRVIYHTDSAQIGADIRTQSVFQSLSNRRLETVRARNLDGDEIIDSIAPIPGTPWSLVAEQSLDALLSPGASYGRFLVLLLVLGVVVPAVVVMAGVRRITEPIDQLIVAAKEVAGGKFGQKLQVHTGDELEELVQQFNRMSARLEESYTTLQAREERLDLVIRGANDGIWDWDLRTNDVYFSPRWKSMLGYTDDEIANRFESWLALIHPEDHAVAQSMVDDYVQGRIPTFELEHRLRHKDGSFRWILARGRALADAGGKPYRMVGSHMDITERKQTEQAIRQSENRFSQVFHASPIAITITSIQDGRYVDVNEAWLKLFDYTREEVIGKSSLQLNIWARPEQRAEMIRQLQSQSHLRDYEHVAQTKTGQLRDVLVSAEVTEIDNRPYNLSLVLDITERKREQEQIRRQNEYLAALHETTLGVVSQLDVKELLEAIVTRALKLVSAATGFVYLVTEDKSQIQATVEMGVHSRYVGSRLGPGEGLSGKIWQTGQPLVVDDYGAWEGRSRIFDGGNIGPEIGVPLKSGMEVAGVIGLTRPRGGAPFTPDQIDLMIRFAQLASIALENARLHTSLESSFQMLERRVKERTRELSTLLEIVQAVSSSLELNQVLRQVAQGLAAAVGVPDCTIYILDQDKGVLYPTADVELQSPPDQLDPAKDAFTREVLETCRPVVSPANVDRLAHSPGGSTRLGVPFVVKGKVVAIALLANEPTGVFTPEQVQLASGIVNAAAIALENARLYQEEQDRRQEAERRRQVAEALREVVAILNARKSLVETLDYIVTQSCRLMNSDAASIESWQETSETSVIQSECGLTRLDLAGFQALAERNRSERNLEGNQPVILSDTSARAEVLAAQDTPDAILERNELDLLMRNGFRALLSVPIIVQGQEYGVITLYYGQPHNFSEEEIRLGISVAQQAALAVESDRMREQAEQSAAMAERNRLARELHDSVTQSLYSVTLYAEAAARLLQTGKALEAAAHLAELRDTSQEALREMRLLIFELRPLALENTGLRAALQARLEAVEIRGGIQADLEVTGEEHLSPTLQEELYHIAQEALNNVLKHAHASHVLVRLQFDPAMTVLEICDDGVGFAITEHDQGGLGLLGMRERVQRIGAELTIATTPGQGTRIAVLAPSI